MIEEIEHTTKTGTRPAHGRNTGHTTKTSTPTKHTTTNKAGKPVYIGKFADNEKKYKKKLRKIWKYEKAAVSL